MSAPIRISATEAGIVRLFTVDLPPDEVTAFAARNGRWPLAEALGADTLAPEHVELFDVADLSGMGLTRYLSEGHAIPDDQLAPMRARLEALRGTLLILPSRAFSGQAQTLTPRSPLNLIASFSEDRAPVSFEALPDAGAQRTAPGDAPPPPRKRPSDAAMSGRVATVALLVLFALVAVMVWVAS